MAAKKSKRGTSLEPDGEPPVKKLRSADEEERRAVLMSPGLSKLGNMNGLRGARSGEKPAELFRKDLISAMKLPDTEPLQPDDYFLIQDQWRQEWEKGVQVPVNPDNIPTIGAHVKTVNEDLYGPYPFKIPKKLLHSAKDETYQLAVHELHEQQKLAEQVCRYDLDDLDVLWLESLNDSLEEWGEEPVTEYTMEKVIEEIESQCHEEMQVKIKTVEGLGIEYDENVVCDVCRSPDSEDGNEMVFCDKCDICVHQACYGVQTIPDGSWLCRPCALGIRPQCILCPKTGGAMKSTKSGSKWAHVSCSLWIPEVSIGCAEKMEPITKISHIPSSRWSLCCSICRDRSGACIQCSVKTCKTALHVTCAFQNNLEMKTILEDDNAEIQLKAYCQKHTRKIRHEGGLSPRKSESGSPMNSPKKPEEMTEEEKTELRSHRLKKLEEEFYSCVEPEKIAKTLELPDTVADFLYNYWVLKRKSNFNKPLLTPKQEEEDLLLKQQEDSLLARMKMFVHLRQDLERVRNLCYMVNKREKMSRSLQNMKETIFWKQVALLDSEPPKSSETRDAKFIATAHRSAGIYDSYDDIMRMARMVDSEIISEPIVHDLEHIKARPGRPRKESALLGPEANSGMVDDDDDDKEDNKEDAKDDKPDLPEVTESPEQKMEEKVDDKSELLEQKTPRLGRPPKRLGRPPKGMSRKPEMLLPPKMLRRRSSVVSDGEKSVGKESKELEQNEEKDSDVGSPESVPRKVLVEVEEPSNQNENVDARRTLSSALDNASRQSDDQKSTKDSSSPESDDGQDLSIRSLRRRPLREVSESASEDAKMSENETKEPSVLSSPVQDADKPVKRQRGRRRITSQSPEALVKEPAKEEIVKESVKETSVKETVKESKIKESQEPKVKENVKEPKVRESREPRIKENVKEPKVKESREPRVKESREPRVKESRECKMKEAVKESKVKESHEPKVKENVKESKVKDPEESKVKERVKEPKVEEPRVKERVREPKVKEPEEPKVKERVKEPKVKEPEEPRVKERVREPKVKESREQKVKEVPVEESVDEHEEQEKPVKEEELLVKEPSSVNEAVKETAKETPKQTIKETSKEAVKETLKEVVKEPLYAFPTRRSLRSMSEVKQEEETDVNAEVKAVKEVKSKEKSERKAAPLKEERVPSPTPNVKSKDRESHKRILFKEQAEKPVAKVIEEKSEKTPKIEQVPMFDDEFLTPPARVLRSRLSPEAKESPAPERSPRHSSNQVVPPLIVKADFAEEKDSKLPIENGLALTDLESDGDDKTPMTRRTRASDKRLDVVDQGDKRSPKSADVAPQLPSEDVTASPRSGGTSSNVDELSNSEERHLRSRHSQPKENGRLKRRRSGRPSGKFESSQLIIGEGMRQKVQDRLCRINRPRTPIKNLQHYAQKRITSFFSKGDPSNLSQQAMTPRSKDGHYCVNAAQGRPENGGSPSLNRGTHSPRCRRTSSSSHRMTPHKYTDTVKIGSPETRSRRRKADSDLDSDASSHVFEAMDGQRSLRSSRSTTPDYGMRGNRRDLDISHSVLHKKLRIRHGSRGKYSVTPSEVSEDSMETLDSEDDNNDSASETGSYSLRQTRSRTVESADNDSECSTNGRLSLPVERLRTRHIGSPRQLGSPRS